MIHKQEKLIRMSVFEEYNKYLIDNDTDIEIYQYVKEINKKLNRIVPKEERLNLDFMDNFLKLCHTNKMCVSGELLIRYSALSQSSDSNKIKLFLEANNLKKEVDYRHENFLVPVPQGRFNKKLNISYVQLFLNIVYCILLNVEKDLENISY